MHQAIMDLKQDTEIGILPADKGNATVVMDHLEYVTKMKTMLKDDTYRLLKRDPTAGWRRRSSKHWGSW